MKKLVTIKIEIEVDDHGDFDETYLRAGVVDAYLWAQAEGNLSRIADETTEFGGFRVSITEIEEGRVL